MKPPKELLAELRYRQSRYRLEKNGTEAAKQKVKEVAAKLRDWQANRCDEAAVIQALLDTGWLPCGSTADVSVRLPTRDNPLYGKSGGEISHYGGRRRFYRGEWFVTVGKRTTFFYQVENHEPRNGKAIKSCLAEVRKILIPADFLATYHA